MALQPTSKSTDSNQKHVVWELTNDSANHDRLRSQALSERFRTSSNDTGVFSLWIRRVRTIMSFSDFVLPHSQCSSYFLWSCSSSSGCWFCVRAPNVCCSRSWSLRMTEYGSELNVTSNRHTAELTLLTLNWFIREGAKLFSFLFWRSLRLQIIHFCQTKRACL